MPEDFGALRVVDLKEECKKRNLTVGGKKAELISRLEEFEANKGGTSEAAAEEPASALEQGSAEDAKAAAKEILEADKPAKSDAEAAANHKQTEPTVAEEKAPDKAPESHRPRSKGQPATEAVATAQEAVSDAEAADKANAETSATNNAAEGSKSAEQPEPELQLGTASSSEKASAAAIETESPPVVESETPTAEAAASAKDEAPNQVQTAEGSLDVASAQPDALEPKQLAPSGAETSKKEPATAEKDPSAAADKAAADPVPLVAALTDAGMGDAVAGEDAEMVQYDAQSDDEQPAPVKADTHSKSTADADVTKDEKSRQTEAPSTSKAGRHEAGPHASARKRGRDPDEAARDDRKAPRTERRTDVRLSHREKDKEREREKDLAKDNKQTNGDPSSDRRRKHAPISYKPPERTSAQADKHRAGTDISRRESRLDKKPSDADRGHDSATRKSDLDRTVSRTESGHKLSVFERLQRGKGEGGSGSAGPSTGREPIPTPGASKSKEVLPRTSSHSRRNQPTQALRIDGFVRPLTVPKTQAMLSEFGEIQKLWMPSIRTHAFVVFATAEQAETCLKATAGLNWPQGNLGSTLSPKFVTVEEAELAIARAGGGPAPASAPATANGVAAGAPYTALDAALPAAGHRSDRRAVLDDQRRAHHDDPRDRRRVGGQHADGPEAAPAPQVDNPPTLDELFRKTTTKPCLYWLPLTDAQAAERKRELDAAAAKKADAGEAQEAVVPMIVA